MSFMSWTLKMIVSIAFDVMDFFIGRIPGVGTAIDIGGGILGVALWGTPGALQFIEILDVTDQIDAFLPSLTIAGLLRIREISD